MKGDVVGKKKGKRSQDGDQRDEHDPSRGLCCTSQPQCFPLIIPRIPDLESQPPPPLSPHTRGTGGTWKESPRQTQTRSQQTVTELNKVLFLHRDQQWSLTLTCPEAIWGQVTIETMFLKIKHKPTPDREVLASGNTWEVSRHAHPTWTPPRWCRAVAAHRKPGLREHTARFSSCSRQQERGSLFAAVILATGACGRLATGTEVSRPGLMGARASQAPKARPRQSNQDRRAKT